MHARALVLLLGLSLVVLAARATQLAVGWYGHPAAGMMVDVGATVSNIGPGGWEAKQQDIAFPDRVVAVDGHALRDCGTRCGLAFSRAIERAWQAHRRNVSVVVESSAGAQREVVLPLQPLEPLVWWGLAGGFLVVGVLWAGAGLLAWWAAPQSALARSTAKFGVLCGLFMLTVFDFHSTGELVPLFYAAFGATPFTWIVLALRLPNDALPSAQLDRLERLTEILGVALAVAFIAWDAAGRSTIVLQLLASSLFGVFVLGFNVIFVVRFIRAKGEQRQTLRALLWALTPYALAGFLLLVSAIARWPLANLLVYPALGLLPIATIWAFIRYDLWGSRALLSRMLTRIAIVTAASLTAAAAGTAAAVAFRVPFQQALLGASAGAVIAAALVALALALSDRVLFPARAAYKPSVAQLSAELTSISAPADVARAIERTVERWLACNSELAALEPEPMAPGEHPARRSLEDGGVALPVLFAAQRLGELRVGPKPGGALFTSEDIELLETIADQGGLALAHAHAYQELEHRRREQAAAWRAERAALVETVAGEICHEVRDPINFLRSVFEGDRATIDATDLEVGREELERLERLFRDLRRMSEKHIERRTVGVRELCERAERLLRDALGERALVMELAEDALIRCDVDKMVQILVNLLSNALEATGANGDVGVRFVRRGSAADLEVWDTGPGFTGDPMSVFAPWYTTKAHGTGLGLAITHRLVQAHDWQIVPSRRDACTVFTISLRAADLPGSARPELVSSDAADVGSSPRGGASGRSGAHAVE